MIGQGQPTAQRHGHFVDIGKKFIMNRLVTVRVNPLTSTVAVWVEL